MNVLAYGREPGGPTDKLCGEDTLLRPSEEPNEAMAGRGPDGRMVPTNRWRTKTPTDRDAMGSHASRIVRPSHSQQLRRCSSGATSNSSQLETVQPEREQTSGSKNLRRMGKYVLRSDPMDLVPNYVVKTTRVAT